MRFVVGLILLASFAAAAEAISSYIGTNGGANIIQQIYIRLEWMLALLTVAVCALYRPPESAPKKGSVKACPDCAETVKAAATVCRYCGHRFEGG